MLRTGLIGVGKMGVSHLALARAHPDLDVVGVCETQGFLLSALEANTGIPGYKRVDTMFDDAGLDCVFIATPTSSHFDLGLMAIDRGVNLFIEKPLTLSHALSQDMASRAKAAGVANQTGYHNRFIGTFREAARLVKGGAIGSVHHVEGRAFGQVVTKASNRVRTWRARKADGGGCLHDYASHVIDLMNFVVGRPDDVVGARLSRIYSADVEDAVHALFTYPGGATGSLETNWSDTSYRKMTTSITIYGSAGKIAADRQECRVYLRDGHSFEDYEPGWAIRYITELQEPVGFYLRGEEYTAQVDAFAAASAAGDAAGPNSFASAADADWVVDRITEANLAGKRVTTALSPSYSSSDAAARFGLAQAVQVAQRRGAEAARRVAAAVRARRRSS